MMLGLGNKTFFAVLLLMFFVGTVLMRALYQEKEMFMDYDDDANEAVAPPDAKATETDTVANDSHVLNKDEEDDPSNDKTKFKHNKLNYLHFIRATLKKDLDAMKNSIDTTIQEVINNIDTLNVDDDHINDEDDVLTKKNEQVATSTVLQHNNDHKDDDNDNDESENDEDDDVSDALDEEIKTFGNTKNATKQVKVIRAGKKINEGFCDGITSPYCLHFSEI
jgi:hypothetical protein